MKLNISQRRFLKMDAWWVPSIRIMDWCHALTVLQVRR